jgi:cytochrome c-type biogenesis protein CcmF
MCYITKPFAKMPAIPLDGLGLNKMLMDPWMVIHPPLVFISYSSMAILFSFCAALTKNADSDNTVYHIKTWIKISWFFLGTGILSGSIWAYRTLGWGGYWSWDPIENAALIPWLILCSCIHRSEYGKSVCIIPFSVACFGVFLARSGILKDRSAHAYTEGNAIITWITISFIIGAIIYLIISKARHAGIRHLKNNIFKYDKRLIIYSLNSYAALIFIGTVAPVLANIQISAAYFNFISIVFALTYIFLLLIWDYKWLKKWNIPMMMVSTILIIGVIVLTDSIKIGWMIVLWICMMPFSLWIVCRFKTKQWRYYLSHAGMILLIIGAISSSALCNDNFIKAGKNDTKVNITGIEVSISELNEKDTLIKSSVKSDAIIKCSDIYPLSQGGFIIPYTTKPLIKLFWIGCFAVVAQPLIIIISNKLFKLFSRFICRGFTLAARAR